MRFWLSWRASTAVPGLSRGGRKTVPTARPVRHSRGPGPTSKIPGSIGIARATEPAITSRPRRCDRHPTELASVGLSRVRAAVLSARKPRTSAPARRLVLKRDNVVPAAHTDPPDTLDAHPRRKRPHPARSSRPPIRSSSRLIPLTRRPTNRPSGPTSTHSSPMCRRIHAITSGSSPPRATMHRPTSRRRVATRACPRLRPRRDARGARASAGRGGGAGRGP